MPTILTQAAALALTPVEIPLDDLHLFDVSEAGSPERNRLFGRVTIAGVGFRLLAWRVELVEGKQVLVNHQYDNEYQYFDQTADPGSTFRSIVIDGLDYVMIMYPEAV